MVLTLQLWWEASERIDLSISIVEQLQSLMELVPSIPQMPSPFQLEIPEILTVTEEEAIYHNLFLINGVKLSTPGVVPWIGPPELAPLRSEEGEEVIEKVPGSPVLE